MSALVQRITLLKEKHAEIQDKKRSLEVEIRLKEENLARAKQSLSEKGIDYETLDELREEIEAKKVRLEDVVSHMESVLNQKQEPEKVLHEEVTETTTIDIDSVVSDNLFDDFDDFGI